MAEEKQAYTEQQRRQEAWARLNALLEEVHSHPADLTPEEIEAEITAAFNEMREIRYGNRSAD